jgi:preprotein translocase subunit SecF
MLTLLLIPAALGVLAYEKATTGDYFQKGVSLKGGDTYTIPATGVDVAALQAALSERHPEGDITVRGVTEFGKLTAIIIEVSDVEESALFASLADSDIIVIPGSYSKESLGAALGATFAKQTILALLIAFLMMAIVVFLTFRRLAPSGYVILAVVSTLIETLAAVALLDVRLSTAGIAAFLMLIGYSVDTDILLTNRSLRQKEGTLLERIYRAMRTGITMTLTAIVTTGIAYLFSDSDVIKQIMLILTIGLLFDLLNTWVQNVGVLRLTLERKKT